MVCFCVWGFTQGTGDVGYVAHLVGLAAGFALAIVLTLLRWVEMDRGERWLSQLFAGEE